MYISSHVWYMVVNTSCCLWPVVCEFSCYGWLLVSHCLLFALSALLILNVDHQCCRWSFMFTFTVSLDSRKCLLMWLIVTKGQLIKKHFLITVNEIAFVGNFAAACIIGWCFQWKVTHTHCWWYLWGWRINKDGVCCQIAHSVAEKNTPKSTLIVPSLLE